MPSHEAKIVTDRRGMLADLGEEDLGLDDTGADIDDDWGMDDEEAEQEA